VSRSQRAQWWNTAAFIAGGVLLASFFLLLAWYLAALLVVVGAATGAWMVAPRRRVQSPHHWDAQERLVREGRPIIYWRPGCMACTRLKLRLGQAGQNATWVDIWADPEAAAFVRDVNGGAEIVPTVILPDGEACTRPDPALVQSHLQRFAEAA